MTQAISNQNNLPYVILNTAAQVEEKTVVVIGCSRGGTSMIAGTLRELGVLMGERMTGSNHEDVEFTTTNIGVLRANIAKRNTEHKVWGWKYPHVTEYLAEIMGDLRNPYFIFVFRNILDVARSYAKYHQKDLPFALQDSYSRYADIVKLAVSCKQPAMLVSFDKALDCRHAFVDGLIGFLGLDISGMQRTNATEFINKKGGYKKASFDKNKIFLSIQAAESLSETLSEKKIISHHVSFFNLNRDNGFSGINNDPQFVLTPDKQHSFPPALFFSFNFETNAVCFESRLYVDFGSGFYAMASQEIPVKNGLNLFRVQFESEFYRLRFDPLNTNEGFSLSDMTIYDAS